MFVNVYKRFAYICPCLTKITFFLCQFWNFLKVSVLVLTTKSCLGEQWLLIKWVCAPSWIERLRPRLKGPGIVSQNYYIEQMLTNVYIGSFVFAAVYLCDRLLLGEVCEQLFTAFTLFFINIEVKIFLVFSHYMFEIHFNQLFWYWHFYLPADQCLCT